MNWIQIVSGPLVGGVIGYFTNYIAVKMLFHPYTPVKIGKSTLPFTPGVIPKRRYDLSRAIANAIEESLFSRDDLAGMLGSDEIQQAVAEGIVSALKGMLYGKTVGMLTDELLGQDRVETFRASLHDTIAQKLVEIDLGSELTKQVTEAVHEKLQKTMFAMFVTSDMIAALAEPIGKRVNAYIAGEGIDKVNGYIDEEIDKLLSSDAQTALRFDEQMAASLSGKIRSVYAAFIQDNVTELVGHIDIGKTVQSKIDAMEMHEFEELVNSVMKNELNTLVNLGAVLGLLIGIINSFI